MKTFKNYFFVFVIAMSFSSLAISQNRMILFEEGTNASCGPCASQNPTFNALLDANTDNVISIKYQWYFPGADPMHDHNPDEPNARLEYYGINGVPTAVLDGTKHPFPSAYEGCAGCYTQSHIDEQLAVSSPLNIELSHEIDGNTITATMDIEAIEDAAGSLVAHIVVIEKAIFFDSPPGTNGETEFYNVMKKMLPSSSGTSLEDFTSGGTVSITESWDMANVYNVAQLAVVAFVQNNDTKEVLQASYSSPIAPDFLNTSTKSILYPTEDFCGNTISPVVKIENNGMDLTSLDISYSVNGGEITTLNWTGELAFLGAMEVELPESDFLVSDDGNYTVEVFTSSPNGGEDSNSDDDIVSLSFLAPSTEFNIISLEIQADLYTQSSGTHYYSEEISWGLFKNDEEIPLYSGGSFFGTAYPENSSELITEVFNLEPNNCYRFEILDAYGDGIAGSSAQEGGYYSLIDGDGNILKTGGDYGEGEMYNFKVNDPVSIDDISENNNSVEIYPNPVKDNLNIKNAENSKIKIYNVLGEEILEIKSASDNEKINLEKYKKGTYFVKIFNKKEVIVKKIVLNN